MSERSEELIRFLAEDCLTEEQAHELLLECRNDAEVLRQAAHLHTVHRLLQAHAPADKLKNDVLASISKLELQDLNRQVEARVMNKIHSMPGLTNRERSRTGLSFSAKAALALAASILVFLGIWWGVWPRWNGNVVAKVVAIHGTVVTQGSKNNGSKNVRLGDLIAIGTILETGGNGEVKLAFANGVADLVLGANSKLLTAKSKSAKTLRLEIGQLTATVVKQPKDNPFVVMTRQAEIRVIGTKFEVLADKKSMQLKVTEGRVQMTRLADEKSVVVEAGFTAEAGDGLALDPKALLPETIAFLREFDQIPLGELTSNKLIRLKEGDGEVTAVVSQPYRGRAPTFKADVFISLETRPDVGDKELYTIPEEMEIRIRIRSEKAGKWGLSQAPSNRRFNSEHFYSQRSSQDFDFDVDTEWQEVVVRRSDIHPYMAEGPTREFLPGVKIQKFTLYGFGTGKLFVDRFAVISLAKDGVKPPKQQATSEPHQ